MCSSNELDEPSFVFAFYADDPHPRKFGPFIDFKLAQQTVANLAGRANVIEVIIGKKKEANRDAAREWRDFFRSYAKKESDAT